MAAPQVWNRLPIASLHVLHAAAAAWTGAVGSKPGIFPRQCEWFRRPPAFRTSSLGMRSAPSRASLPIYDWLDAGLCAKPEMGTMMPSHSGEETGEIRRDGPDRDKRKLASYEVAGE